MENYKVKLTVTYSTLIDVQAENEKEAEIKAKEEFYSGNVMKYMKDSEYYDGIDTNIVL